MTQGLSDLSTHRRTSRTGLVFLVGAWALGLAAMSAVAFYLLARIA